VSSLTPQSGGKNTVECPHCGFKQLESPYAKSTFCRKCSEHYDLGKPAPEPHEDRPSLLERFGQLLSRNKTREITCFDCGAVQTLSSAAKSSLCPQCSAYIDLTDFKITGSFSRKIQTQGTVEITAKADVTSSTIACREAFIYGKMRGTLQCTGLTSVKMSGKLNGALEVKELIIEKRSDVEIVRPVKARTVEINGKVSARLHVDGKVVIGKKGWLEGTIYAKAIVIEKGGVFLGELHIGEQEMSQPELLPLDADAKPKQRNKKAQEDTPGQGSLPFEAAG